MSWIESIQVRKIMNIPLKEGDSFFKKEIYSYIFNYKPRVKTIIELEYYDHNIIVLSFYRDGVGNDKTRYRIRQNYSPIIVLRIFQACLKLFIQLNVNNDFTLVFNAADDVGDYQEYNKRMSSYTSFLEKYYPNFSQECFYSGFMTLNTFYFHHNANPHNETARLFFIAFCEKVKLQLNNPEDDTK